MPRDNVQAVGWPVVILPYDVRWPELFRAERDPLAGIFGERAAGIEHVGSTAVPGLAAKGIVDILIGLRPHELRPADLDARARRGYVYRGELGIPGRHFFQKGGPPTHHVHVVEHGSRVAEARALPGPPPRTPGGCAELRQAQARPGRPLPRRPGCLHRGEVAVRRGCA